MDLWIRSQDRTMLCKPQYIELDSASDIAMGDVKIGYRCVAHYETRERALEVLDEINERISLLNTMDLVHDNNSLISFGKAIGEGKVKGLAFPYQMPEE